MPLKRSIYPVLVMLLFTAACSFRASQPVRPEQLAGLYEGSFTNSDGEERYIFTEFRLDSNILTGQYASGTTSKDRLQDTGTLTLTHIENDQLEFLWCDEWGSGKLRLHFDPGTESFLGIWTFKEKIEGTWTGKRLRI